MSLAGLRPRKGHAWPVLVVGAGPSGALAACLLARAGIEVLLVDRADFPRWKVCGCCLNPWALASLRETGLDPILSQNGAVPLDRLELTSAGHAARLPLPPGVALSRGAFDQSLIEAAQSAGARFLPRTVAQALPPVTPLDPDRRVLLQSEGKAVEVMARVLLAADGLGGRLLAHEPGAQPRVSPRSRIGAGALAECPSDFFVPGTVYMAVGPGGYVGLVRVEDGRLDLAAALDPPVVKRLRLGGAVRQVLEQSGWRDWPDPERLDWRGTPPLTRQRRRVAGPRLFVLGDAAGYVEPFTGEGIAWALASATAVVPLVREALDQWRPTLADRWQSRHRALFASSRRRCLMVTTLLRSPLLTVGLVRLLARFPFLARPWIPAEGHA